MVDSKQLMQHLKCTTYHLPHWMLIKQAEEGPWLPSPYVQELPNKKVLLRSPREDSEGNLIRS